MPPHAAVDIGAPAISVEELRRSLTAAILEVPKGREA
jgi:hypothetical protein